VSLTYDDSIPTHLAHAAPDLRAAGLLGTFFLNDVRADTAPWIALRQEGNELGFHTFHHPCLRSYDWVPEGNASEDYDLARIAADLDGGVRLLADLGQPPPFTYAYPCGETKIGEPLRSYVPLVAARFLAARGVFSQLATRSVDLFHTPAVFTPEDVTGEQLVEWVREAEKSQAWVIFGFHGVGGDYHLVAREAHTALLDYLRARRDTVWTAPFGTVAACVRSAPRATEPSNIRGE
jgi:peptidoglycan/xylan/chitin deacetylase (PgdA/CDA1 family)